MGLWKCYAQIRSWLWTIATTYACIYVSITGKQIHSGTGSNLNYLKKKRKWQFLYLVLRPFWIFCSGILTVHVVEKLKIRWESSKQKDIFGILFFSLFWSSPPLFHIFMFFSWKDFKNGWKRAKNIHPEKNSIFENFLYCLLGLIDFKSDFLKPLDTRHFQSNFERNINLGCYKFRK